MALLKRIIDWIISFFRNLFKRKKKKNSIKKVDEGKKDKKKKNKVYLDGEFNDELPSYMIINDHDKEMLLYSIALLKNFLEETNVKRREQEEKKFFKMLEQKYDIKVKEIENQRQLDVIVKNISNEDRKTYYDIIKRDEDFNIHLKEIDRVINRINNEKISIIENNEIDREISKLVNDKNIKDDLENKIDYFNKNVFELIDNIDEDFIKNVVRDYEKVNYITISTKIVDKNYERFKKLEEDFKNHRYNKYYYEREINKIKHELKQIKNLKNKKEVSEHILKLRKELFTKSKDKYDLLYNDEIFLNFDKECDLLLDKINTKVVDIKKDKVELEKKEENQKKKQYLENILLRFKDMELAREYIELACERDEELLNLDEDAFIEKIYQDFNNGIMLKFNYERNKQKTELVVLLNGLNAVINKKSKEPYITLNHINFRMNDLVEAVEVKQDILNRISYKKETEEMSKANDKLESLIEKHNVKKKEVK